MREETKAADYLLSRGSAKRVGAKRRLELKQAFEQKAQSLLDRLAAEIGDDRIRGLDYGRLVNTAIREFFPDMEGRYYESFYKPLSPRKSHDNAILIRTSPHEVLERRLDELAELTALYYSFTNTRTKSYELPSMPESVARSKLGTRVEDALDVRFLQRYKKEDADKPRNLLVAGIGMDGIRMMDFWKGCAGTLHLVDVNPFIASTLRHYARINGHDGVVVHQEDISKLRLPLNSLDHAKLDHCMHYIKAEHEDRLLDGILPALKEGGAFAVFENEGFIEKQFVDKLVQRGMKVSTSSPEKPERLLALKQKPGEPGEHVQYNKKLPHGIKILGDSKG
jgi:hypothetical protein